MSSEKSQKIKIRINGLEVFAHHGMLSEERELGQIFRFDIGLSISGCAACDSDDMAGTVNYAEVADRVVSVATSETYYLLEKLVAVIADDIIVHFPTLEKVRVKATKNGPPMGHAVDSVSVSMERKRSGH